MKFKFKYSLLLYVSMLANCMAQQWS